jgi:hypothetical protein
MQQRNKSLIKVKGKFSKISSTDQPQPMEKLLNSGGDKLGTILMMKMMIQNTPPCPPTGLLVRPKPPPFKRAGAPL